MCLKRVEKKKLLGLHKKNIFKLNILTKWVFNYFLKNGEAATGVVL